MTYIINTIMYAMIFIYGSVIGSFLNVVIYRVPRKENIAKGRSHCPVCGTQIKNYDLIPILSYLLLKGSCRNCQSHISKRYPLVEIATGVICVFTFWMNGINVTSACLCIFASILLAIGLIDWDTMTIPDELVISIIICAIPFFFLQPEIAIWSRIAGFFIVSLPMLVLAMIIPGAFGGGDIKLMAASGLILGMANSVVAVFIGILIGGSYAIYLLYLKKIERKDHMPFGPSLCIGCYLGCLYGGRIIEWYLGFF